jgi:hypothetical protein
VRGIGRNGLRTSWAVPDQLQLLRLWYGLLFGYGWFRGPEPDVDGYQRSHPYDDTYADVGPEGRAMTNGLFNFNTALTTESASGSYIISTNGTIIQAATTYTACTTGTGTYNLKMTVEQLQ